MTEQIIVLLTLAVAIILFLSERFPPDLVALGVLAVLGLSGVLTPAEAISGLGRSTVVTLISMSILVQGLKQAGWTEVAAAGLVRLSGKTQNPNRLVALTMAFSIALTLVMNNISVAAVLLPSILALARLTELSPTRLLLPMAMATMVGGAASLFTTANLVSSGVLHQAGYRPFGVLDFIPLGIVLAAVTFLFLLFPGKFLLPKAGISNGSSRWERARLTDTYELGERLIQVRIPDGSPLDGVTIQASGIRSEYKFTLVAINRGGVMLRLPPAGMRLRQGDILTLEGRYQEFDWATLAGVMEPLPNQALPIETLQSDKIRITEAVLAPRSSLIGQTLVDIRFGDRYGVQVLGIWRNGKPIRSELSTRSIQLGDSLLLYGPTDRILHLREDRDLILLNDPSLEEAPARRRSKLALGIFVVSILLSIIFTEQLSLVLLAGAVVMVGTGVLSTQRAYASVEWRVIFLVVGMLPLGLAITKTGLADQIIGLILPLAERFSPYVAFILLYLVTLLFAQLVHGAVVATIMVPLAIRLAQETGMDPRSIVMGIALATSLTLMTPLGHPVSMLVMTPGGYKFKDYVRVGLPLAALLSAVLLVLLPVFWPL